MSIPDPGITLVLGGGGSRGIAHLGVLQKLEEAQIPIHRIVGLSMGGLIGAMYAYDPHARQCFHQARKYLLSDRFLKHQQTLFGAIGANPPESNSEGFFSWYQQLVKYIKNNHLLYRFVSSPSILPGVIIKDVVNTLIPSEDLSETQIPLSLATTDLVSGHQMLLERGDLQTAVLATTALPGIFPPIKMEQMLLVDSGHYHTLPNDLALSYGNRPVVSVEVSGEVSAKQDYHSALDVLTRMDEIGENYWRKQTRSCADLVIRPNVAHALWYDFSQFDRLVQLGYEVTEKRLQQIRDLLNSC